MEFRSLVNIFLVGAGKSGTSALAYALSKHPKIYLPNLKEPHYFAQYSIPEWREVDPFGDKLVTKKKDYLMLYRNAEDSQMKLDASTSYLHKKGTAVKIKDYNPNAKIIMMLRNPVERAYSHFKMNVNAGYENNNFIDALNSSYLDSSTKISNYIRIGLYYKQVEEYLNQFDKHHIHILIYEEYINNKKEEFCKILEFLNLNPENYNYKFLEERINESLAPKHKLVRNLLSSLMVRSILKKIISKRLLDRIKKIFYVSNKSKISEEQKKIAFNYFKDDIDNLEKLININLNTWKV